MDAPEPYASIIEERMNADRDYFERNPSATTFIRPAVPGEFWPEDLEFAGDVLVRSHGIGARSRQQLRIHK